VERKNNTQSPLACNLRAFNTEEHERYAHERYADLTKQLRSAVAEERELDDGYALRIAAESLPPIAIAEWIALEQKCCPFFAFELRFEADGGPVWLQLSGRPGVKDFIRDKFR
jgi:hypothetical protein